MADIRKRIGSKGITYQVRYPSKASPTGYAYETFATLKEAREFREDSAARSKSGPLSKEIRTVEQGLQKWLDVCAKEGRNGRDPVTAGTMENYEYRAAIIRAYDWQKPLHELTAPDIVEPPGPAFMAPLPTDALPRRRFRHATAGIRRSAPRECLA
jgi:integrase